jgi:hypothetical protein
VRALPSLGSVVAGEGPGIGHRCGPGRRREAHRPVSLAGLQVGSTMLRWIALPCLMLHRFWWRLGLVSFGGPAGPIALLHEELVERRRWLSERRFLHALNDCLLLPGPEATQLATNRQRCGGRRDRQSGAAVRRTFPRPGRRLDVGALALFLEALLLLLRHGWGVLPLIRSAAWVGVLRLVVLSPFDNIH